MRASLVLPGPILDYRISHKVGSNQIDIRRIGIVASKYLDKEWGVVGPRQIYSNGIFINVDKPTYESTFDYEGTFDIELILELNRKDFSYEMNILDVKYRYANNDGEKTEFTSEVSNIEKKNAGNVLYVDKSKPLSASL